MLPWIRIIGGNIFEKMLINYLPVGELGLISLLFEIFGFADGEHVDDIIKGDFFLDNSEDASLANIFTIELFDLQLSFAGLLHV